MKKGIAVVLDLTRRIQDAIVAAHIAEDGLLGLMLEIDVNDHGHNTPAVVLVLKGSPRKVAFMDSHNTRMDSARSSFLVKFKKSPEEAESEYFLPSDKSIREMCKKVYNFFKEA